MLKNSEVKESRVYSVQDIQIILAISKNTAYMLVNDNPPFTVHRIRNEIQIPIENFDDWFNNTMQ